MGQSTSGEQDAVEMLNGPPFVIDTLLNYSYSEPALIESGCACLAAVSNSPVREMNLPRIKVKPRKLTEATECKQKSEGFITEMTKMILDIDGCQTMLHAYIIPHLSHKLILEKPWMERDDVYHAKDHRMDIRKALIDETPLSMWEKGFQERSNDASRFVTSIAGLSAGVFLATIKRAQKYANNKGVQLFCITLADIQKALAPAKKLDKSLEKLPKEYRDFIDIFKRDLIDRLPPHHPGHDHKIRVEPKKEIPWGPLYGMSRDELLVLRKTLTELLDKNYIRANNSPAGAPVLFVRKPGGVLRFCVDYRAFNAISKADRYPVEYNGVYLV
ncbi:hypothetical protein K3495_g12599 [Podosphaera aphanis]|nr:hypothetical protein K3495_g12599 [Podosphaera aphanis]